MFCSSCGKELVGQSNFCENCGAAVEQDSSSSLDNREVPELEKAQPAKTSRIGFGEAVKSAFQNTFNYDARSTRAEYWWFVLFCLLSVFAMGLILAVGNVSGQNADGIVTVFGILLIPSWLSLYVRRLHDLNHSGWAILLLLIPFINFFLGLYFILAPSYPTGNVWRRLH